MKSFRNHDAVSPVIGEMLMIVITIVLATVIAGLLMGVVGNLQKTKVVAVTAERTGASSVSLTYHGGQDTSSLSSLALRGDVSGTAPGTTVGSTSTATLSKAVNAHCLVVGTFTDGTQQVILDTFI
jgi:FlaG/FlaF family flagellin (archaellin)